MRNKKFKPFFNNKICSKCKKPATIFRIDNQALYLCDECSNLDNSILYNLFDKGVINEQKAEVKN